MLEVCWNVWICRFRIFISFATFQDYSNLFFVLPFLLLRMPTAHALGQKVLMLCSFFSQSVSSVWILYWHYFSQVQLTDFFLPFLAFVSYFFAYLTILDWIPAIMNLTLLTAGHPWIFNNIFELCSEPQLNGDNLTFLGPACLRQDQSSFSSKANCPPLLTQYSFKSSTHCLLYYKVLTCGLVGI